jgi:folate-dependent tRNA-U54 methylase TrmFO/GidA
VGSIHRNSYLNFPARLSAHGALRARPELIFAGQLTGVEGYTESAASGILAGVNLDRVLAGRAPVVPPPTTMIGALFRYLRESPPDDFQPMNSNWGLVEPLSETIRDKQRKRQRLAERAQEDSCAGWRSRGSSRAPRWRWPGDGRVRLRFRGGRLPRASRARASAVAAHRRSLPQGSRRFRRLS